MTSIAGDKGAADTINLGNGNNQIIAGQGGDNITTGTGTTIFWRITGIW